MLFLLGYKKYTHYILPVIKNIQSLKNYVIKNIHTLFESKKYTNCQIYKVYLNCYKNKHYILTHKKYKNSKYSVI